MLMRWRERKTNMLTIRRANERGAANHGWLDTKHTFSFANYFDPRHLGFRALRVINEDKVLPGEGFGTHGHRDMEILSYVLEGALKHQDSMGSLGVLRPGEVQRMSAGTGVRHSEFNGSDAERVHFLQIWLVPDRNGHEPSWEQRDFGPKLAQGAPVLLASADGRDGSLPIHCDASVYAVRLKGQATVPLAQGRHAWVHVARGAVTLNGQALGSGDGAALTDEAQVQLDGEAEVLVFDLG
jgi:redox-sensitive bicupin YhaK (pirin superfamily)